MMQRASGSLRGRRRRRLPRSKAGYAFVAAYAAALVLLGLFPTGYAIYLAFRKSNGGFAGVSNFTQTGSNFQFLPAVIHVAVFLAIWLVVSVVMVVTLALLVQRRASFASKAFRFIYYLPGALTGVGSVIIWLFILDPTASPFAALLHILGLHSFGQSIAADHLPVIFTLMAFWAGGGGWILVMYGALNNIPDEILDAAAIDGCSSFRLAVEIKLPLIAKWIAYMVILSIAAGSQLFVEPQTLAAVSGGVISPSWSLNELAYNYAFQQFDFNGAAAISIDLLAFGLICAIVIVLRTRVFDQGRGMRV